MTTKHFKELAEMLGEHKACERSSGIEVNRNKDILIDKITRFCARMNPRFKSQVFRDAIDEEYSREIAKE